MNMDIKINDDLNYRLLNRPTLAHQLWFNKFRGKATISKTLILIISKSSQS